MFPAFNEYCTLIAQLPGQFPSIRSSTLQAHTIGPFAAEVEGQVVFESGYLLDVWELSTCAIGHIPTTQAANAKRIERERNHWVYSLLWTKVVRAANASDPDADQLIPLCF